MFQDKLFQRMRFMRGASDSPDEADFTSRDGQALLGLLADHSLDIIVKTDCEGTIRAASPGAGRLGWEDLIGQKLTDLVCECDAKRIQQMLLYATAHATQNCACKPNWSEVALADGQGCNRWFEIGMCGVADRHGRPVGVLCILRCVQQKKLLELQLAYVASTDLQTGLPNQIAFARELDRVLAGGKGGCLAIANIDGFKAITLRHGRSSSERIVAAVAGYIGQLVDAKIVFRLSGESIALLLEGERLADTVALCRLILAGVADLDLARMSGNARVTMSCGVAEIARSADETLRRAELALAHAVAKGRNRIEVEPHPSGKAASWHSASRPVSQARRLL